MHYSVLVVGPDPEVQMALYDENLEVTPYEDVCWDCEGSPKFIDACTECNGSGKCMTTRNPMGEWDYFRLGGRYRGLLRVHPGSPVVMGDLSYEWTFNGPDDTDWTDRADQAPKRLVDFERLRAECVTDGGEPYRTYVIVAEGVWQSRERKDDWVAWWDRFVNSLGPDVLLTVYDIHS